MKTPQLSSKQKCKQRNLALALAMSMVSICCLEEKQNKTKQYNKASYSGTGLTPTQKLWLLDHEWNILLNAHDNLFMDLKEPDVEWIKGIMSALRTFASQV